MFDESNRLEKECLPTQYGIRVEKNQPQTTQVFKKVQTKNDNSIQRKQVLSNDVTNNTSMNFDEPNCSQIKNVTPVSKTDTNKDKHMKVTTHHYDHDDDDGDDDGDDDDNYEICVRQRRRRQP